MPPRSVARKITVIVLDHLENVTRKVVYHLARFVGNVGNRHPEITGILIEYAATTMLNRYDQSDDIQDVENAILCYLYSDCRFWPPGHPYRLNLLNNLAAGLVMRYCKLGKIKDLEDSILFNADALSLCPPGHPDRERSLNNLAAGLGVRYTKFGNAKDLEESIFLYTEVLNLYPHGHPRHPILTNNIANAFSARYDRLGNGQDLEDCILLCTDALNNCPSGHPSRPMSLNNLGVALNTRYSKLANIEDLESSISFHTEALNLRPPGHRDRTMSLNNLGSAFSARYDKTGNVQDLEDCIVHYTDALNFCPPGYPDRSVCFNYLGVSFMTRAVLTKKGDDLSNAFLYFEQAASDCTSHIHDRVDGAINWVTFAQSFHHESIFKAYTTMFQLVNRSLIFRPNVEAQQRFLASANIPRSLASDAASAAIEAGKLELAVEFLEQGRAFLWSRINAYKYPLQELRQVKGGEKLADRLQAVSTRLEHLSWVSSSATSNQKSSTKGTMLNHEIQEHRVLSEEWEDIVGEIRKIEGFSHFLQAAPFHVLRLAATEGPVILVNISTYRSDAIILLNDADKSPELVNLPEVLLPELWSQKCGTAKEITNTLAYLWDTIVSPVVDCLDRLQVKKGSRIWWCPTAQLCALPLHAAGRGKRHLQDIYVSSYTSTLSSLIKARSNIIRPPITPQLLVVGQPSTDLKRVQDEVDIIQNLRPDVDVLFGPSEATREAVIEGLKDHPWVHFACHGLLGDEKQPFHASFKLHEDIARRLPLLDLVQARLPNAELAFLSACHSAAGGLSTPDESIHLSSALQFCGFKSVIGTLWEMDDEDGPTISEKFYTYMFRNPDKVDFRDSARALNVVIKELRKEKVPPERLAMFVHIGA